MKIVADENLALTEYFFSDFGEIHQVSGRNLNHADVKNAEALLIRSVTRVDETLIQQTGLKFIGSATIGTDHLDIPTIEKHAIAWSNAAGCNAQAVAEYVLTALVYLKPELLSQHSPFSLGIIGLGNVGKRLAYMAGLLGWTVLGYDPLVQSGQVQQVDLDTLLKSVDAVSIHVPLTESGPYPTWHLINAERLGLLKPDTMLVNTARGAVIEEAALMSDIQQTQRKVVLDVFEHEPEISEQLLNVLSLATPHIAGYSLEGKARGTQMIYEAFCHTFQLQADKRFETQLTETEAYFTGKNMSTLDLKAVLQQYLHHIYDIARDDADLHACIREGKVDQKAFDQLRRNYPLRREWAAHGGPAA
ncbi:4-phosphoerythronate dehydrogenase [Acinetobacter sp. WZC-1]|uniref:4-phosphoerythronate dehydrogenase n=1 Tax=Acinetobacter sp. WZC-1 TaxID=3459034 RepID=UPI00403DADBD